MNLEVISKTHRGASARPQRAGSPGHTEPLAGIAFLLLILSTLLFTSASSASSAVSLTVEERAYLSENVPIIFVSQTNYPPFEFVDQAGDRSGIMIELARWISTELGFHAEFTDTVFQQAQLDVLQGNAHVLTSLFYSAARDESFDFTETVFEVPASIFVRIARPDITGLRDLDGKRIAMQRGDYAEGFLNGRGISYTLVPTEDFASAARAVIDGEADAMIGDEQIVLHFLYSNQLNERMKIVGDPLYVGLNAMAVKDGNRLLQSILNKGVVHARQTGTLERLNEKWVGTTLPSAPVDWRIFWPYAGAAAFLLAWFLAWNVRLRQIVRRRTSELRRKERRLRDILNGTRAGTWELNLHTGAFEINDFWARAIGYELGELTPMSAERFQSHIHPDDLSHYKKAIARHLAGETDHYACEMRLQHRDGHWVWMMDRGQIARRSGSGEAVIISGTQIDISKRKEYEQQLQRMAYFDELTGLPNRVLLIDRLRQAMVRAVRRNDSIILAYIDLDGFKEINDICGHDVGDQVLIEISRRLETTLRSEDTIARFGGDEFVVVLTESSQGESLDRLLTRLISRIAEPIRLDDDRSVTVSGSIGCVNHRPDSTLEPEQLIRHADQAMYQAKQAGKNRYHVFDTEHERAMRGYHESVEAIREALTRNEFVLHYQPKLNMRNGELVGVEALIRWQHPERGLLPPAAFLPAIQDHLLAVDLGQWVLSTALAQCMRWREAGQSIPVSVNIDAIHLQQPDFIDRLKEELKQHRAFQPGDLELEILETSALEDVAHVSLVINACQEIGVDFALDDFGTGYSSLTYLKHLPAGLLKIDRSFVRDMLDDPEDLTILEGVLGLAHAFRRSVIAEGVETAIHGQMLLAMGCELGQGYAISHPLPAEAFDEWLKQHESAPAWSQVNRNQGDPAVIRAIVEHRSCLAGLINYVNGVSKQPPEIARNPSRLGQWLKSVSGEGQLPAAAVVREIATAHEQYLHDRQRIVADDPQKLDPCTRQTIAARLESLRVRQLDNLARYLGQEPPS